MFNLFLLLTSLSYIMQRALKNLEERLGNMNEELSFMANVDPLTKILNRRSMERFIFTAVNTGRSAGSQIAFIAVDIDNFKTVNDTWGHKCGDMVLEEVSRTIAGTIREGDRIARWGGEEFLVILMKSGMDGAAVLAERMRKAVAATQVKFEETVVSVTASFGISMCGADCEPDDCLLRADRALYQGKKTGRNRVVCWTPDLDG